MPRRAAWWLIGLLLACDAAASGWLWLLWMEREARRHVIDAGATSLSKRHAVDPSAAVVKQRVR